MHCTTHNRPHFKIPVRCPTFLIQLNKLHSINLQPSPVQCKALINIVFHSIAFNRKTPHPFRIEFDFTIHCMRRKKTLVPSSDSSSRSISNRFSNCAIFMIRFFCFFQTRPDATTPSEIDIDGEIYKRRVGFSEGER